MEGLKPNFNILYRLGTKWIEDKPYKIQEGIQFLVCMQNCGS